MSKYLLNQADSLNRQIKHHLDMIGNELSGIIQINRNENNRIRAANGHLNKAIHLSRKLKRLYIVINRTK